ncbi:MAG: conjugal transfer protein [Lachnospiraceae bacterium]|nr:conjugal transfer protein [Lachnospiraceae bacterium]
MERVEQMLRYALQLSYLNQLHKAGKITESKYLRIKKNLMKDYGVVSDILAGWK